MPDITLTTLDAAPPDLIEHLLERELESWMSELGWDYTLVCRILLSFIRRRALPGFAAIDSRSAAGYTYFLVHGTKGVIGTVYRAGTDVSHSIVDSLQNAAIDSLQANPKIRRIEAQVMPFHDVDLTAVFERRGFECHPRHFLQMDLNALGPRRCREVRESLIAWNPCHLEEAARVAQLGYRNQIDAHICADYGSEAGCLGFLRSLIETPGCGTFLPLGSFEALDDSGRPCGFIIVSRISATGAMIPQISISPAHQGHGIGKALMDAALHALAAQGYKTVALAVTATNRRACEWYLRLGFRVRKSFSACLWQAPAVSLARAAASPSV